MKRFAMPEDIIHILCTRRLDQLLISKAAEKNIFIDVVPFITTEPVATAEFKQKSMQLLAQPIDIVFTSMHAVEAVAQYIQEKPSWKIWSVGGITKDTVKKKFGEKTIAGTAKNATTLAEKIIASKSALEVYFFCGDQRLDDLPETLKRNDIAVHEIIAYNTIQTPQQIEENYDGIMFFSPSAVHSFFSMNTIPVNVVMFSIGKTTSGIIHSYCTNKVITSEWPGAESLFNEVMKYFGH